MADLAVAERYARALVDLGEEEGLVDQFLADLTTFQAVLDLPDVLLVETLSHPAFALEERKAILDDILAKLDLHKHSANFLRLCLEKGRFRSVPAIVASYTLAADTLAGRVRAVVTTAEPMTKALEKKVQASLAKATGKTILIDSKVDPLLIGGVVAQVEGRIFDASLRTRLVNLHQTLLLTNPEQALEA
ncbi:MAG: ATP synthase F1 subunit delta [Proteobacteria bacterium]|nr:ATP synthase F1 subunit delta [Pseudomonadota bacterium]MCP4918661.1 ATP synthase F1 subunit delta [Pseudomonadota bacterium]